MKTTTCLVLCKGNTKARKLCVWNKQLGKSKLEEGKRAWNKMFLSFWSNLKFGKNRDQPASECSRVLACSLPFFLFFSYIEPRLNRNAKLDNNSNFRPKNLHLVIQLSLKAATLKQQTIAKEQQ